MYIMYTIPAASTASGDKPTTSPFHQETPSWFPGLAKLKSITGEGGKLEGKLH